MVSTSFLPLAVLAFAAVLSEGRSVSDGRKTSESLHKLSRANQEFSVNLYKELVRPRENLIVSGQSVATVLAMLLQGSQGTTHSEVLSALRYDKLVRQNVEEGYEQLAGLLKGNDDFSLATANSIWINKAYKIADLFKEKVSQVFHAEARALNLGTAKNEINQYVAEKTENLIKSLLEEEPKSDTAMILINAIFFKGTWKTRFDNKTFPAGFIDNDDEVPADASSAVTRFMRLKEQLLFTESQELKAEIVELPYKGEETSMVVLLPSQGTTLVELEESLTPEKFQKAIDALKPTDISMIMPKFKIESSLNMVKPLTRLGVQEIFSRQANLAGIGEGLQVSDVLQKAAIEVTQEGSKAAAATAAIVMVKPSITPPEPTYRLLRIVHPFMFVLRHKPTESVLFLGRYSKSAPYNENEN